MRKKRNYLKILLLKFFFSPTKNIFSHQKVLRTKCLKTFQTLIY